MQQRYYDPVIGRFYSNDPVDMLGHMQKGNPTMGFNRYAYANNNPYKYTDPDGEFPALGFIAGVALEVTRQALTGEIRDTSFSGIAKNAGKVLVSGLAGATGAGLATKAASLGILGRTAVNAGGGAVIGASSTVANNAIDGKNLTDNIGTGAVIGSVAGAAGSLVGDGINAAKTMVNQNAFNKLSVSDQNLVQHIKQATGASSSNTVGVADAVGNSVANSNGIADSCGVQKQC